jgi:ribosome biogenesis protein BMS1
VHIAGVGDCKLAGVSALEDPCPLPSATKKKGLREKEKLLYSPWSNVGEVLYDKDATYVDINDHQVQYSRLEANGAEVVDPDSGVENDDVGVAMVKTLQNTKYSIDEKLNNSFIQLFRGSGPMKLDSNDAKEKEESEEEESEDDDDGDEDEDEDDQEDEDEDDDEVDAQAQKQTVSSTNGKIARKSGDSESDEEDDEDEEEGNQGSSVVKKSSSGKAHSKAVVRKVKPSEVQEFANGRMRRRAFFEDEEEGDAGPSGAEIQEHIEYDDSSDESVDLNVPNKVRPSDINRIP